MTTKFSIIPTNRQIVPIEQIENTFEITFCVTIQGRYDIRPIKYTRVKHRFQMQETAKIWEETALKDHRKIVRNQNLSEWENEQNDYNFKSLIFEIMKNQEVPIRYKPKIIPIDYEKFFDMKKIKDLTANAKRFFKSLEKKKAKFQKMYGKKRSYDMTKHESEKFSYYSGLENLDDKIKIIYDNKIMKAVFNMQFISLIEQKKILFSYVPFFKAITQKDGVPFEEYIDKWAKRLLRDNVGGKLK
jgi:hypothetical protein